MQVPLEVSFRDVERTEDLEDYIAERAGGLERMCDHMTSCRIAVERPHKSQRAGNPFRVRIAMHVPPGHELTATHEPSEKAKPEPLKIVIGHAFDAAERQLRGLTDRQQDKVKRHPEQESQAVVVRLFPDQGYGFLKALDGREVYFHRNSVTHDDFDRLEVGTGVRFVEQAGDKGPQASTVQIVDKPGARASKSDQPRPKTPPGWEA